MKINYVNKFVASVFVAVMLIPTLTLGATLKAGEEVFITKGNDIQDNLYIAGGNISINSTVFGDLLAAGGNILISENVTEDMAIAGGSITILGDSGGDVRIAGGNILAVGKVAGDLAVAGGSIVISSDVSVGKDLVVAGGQATIDGEVTGDTDITAGVATINGHVRGDVKAMVDEKLTIGEGAIIDGNLAYSAHKSQALELSEGAVVTGEIVFKEIAPVEKVEAKNALAAALGAALLLKLLATIITALILTKLFGRFSNSVVSGVVQNPLRMLSYGFVTLVVAPAASIILFVTLFGIPLGLMVMISYGLLVLVSCIYTGVVLGAWLGKIISKSDHAVVTWKNVVGGVLLLTIINLVPVVGWIIGLLLFLVTLGSITNLLHKKLWTER